MAQKRSTTKTRKAPAKAAPVLKRSAQGAAGAAGAKGKGKGQAKAQGKAPGKAQSGAKNAARGGNAGAGYGAHFGAMGTGAGAGRSSALDIVGVLLIIEAIALAVLIFIPTEAPVAYWINFALTWAFGVGAILLPLAILVWALSLLFQGSASVSGRFALGLFFIVSALLSLITLLSAPVGLTGPSLTYLTLGTFAASHGGAWGGLIAWALLSSVGAAISLVVLCGLVVVGAVICGFSISGLIARLRERHAIRREDREEPGAHLLTRFGVGKRRPGIHAAVYADDVAAADAAGGLVGATGLGGPAGPGGVPTARLNGAAKTRKMAGQKTSFIGGRKTSVLKRNPMGSEVDEIVGADLGAGVAHEEKTFHPELTSFVEPTGAIAYEYDEEVEGADAAGINAMSGGAAQDGTGEDGLAKASLPRRGTKRQDSTSASADEIIQEEFAGTGAAVGTGVIGKEAVDEAAAGARAAAGAEAATTAAGVGAGTRAITAATAGDDSTQSGAGKKKEEKKEDTAHASTEVALPPMSLLQSNPQSGISAANEKDLQKTAERLQATLEEFGLKARVKGWVSGPLVTTFKIEMGEGERVNKITNLEDDIALALAAASVRIFAPIPGTSLVGIEIPNAKRTNVCLGDVLTYAQGGPLELAVGRDSEGHPHIIDLAKLPHLLVAGTTGSGKSVMLNAAIMSILMRATPDQVRLIMVDPKRVEFTCYAGLPHLYVPVVNEPKQAASALQWSVSEMERRLRIFEKAAARDIGTYNNLVKRGKLGEETEPMPYFVIVIDELADLMMVAGKEVESSIVRIAQLGRAAGIHLIVATQRPSADVVTGLIKANIDNRVALSVDNGTNSRIIIDQNGAEKLLGNGDMLIKLRGRTTPQRIQGCYVSDPEIQKTVSFISEQTEAEYHAEILTAVVPTGPGNASTGAAEGPQDDDPLVWDAAEIVVKSRLGSTSGLQRSLRVGYARAGRIMDMLEAKGIVGPPDGAKPREVLVTQEELEEMRSSTGAGQEEFEEMYS